MAEQEFQNNLLWLQSIYNSLLWGCLVQLYLIQLYHSSPPTDLHRQYHSSCFIPQQTSRSRTSPSPGKTGYQDWVRSVYWDGGLAAWTVGYILLTTMTKNLRHEQRSHQSPTYWSGCSALQFTLLCGPEATRVHLRLYGILGSHYWCLPGKQEQLLDGLWLKLLTNGSIWTWQELGFNRPNTLESGFWWTRKNHMMHTLFQPVSSIRWLQIFLKKYATTFWPASINGTRNKA